MYTMATVIGTKVCLQCEREKNLPDDFWRHKGRKDGFAERCKACCKKNYNDDPEYHRQVSRDSHVRHRDKENAESRARFKAMLVDEPERILWYKAKERARALKLPFTLTVDDLVIPEFCPVLGIPLIHGKGKWHANSPTVDRRIPELGYTKGNARVISWRANDLKKDGTLEEFQKIVAYMESI